MNVPQFEGMPMYKRVAAEVRAELARADLNGSQAAARLGWKQQYISRRLSGTVPFDVAELYEIAEMLDVPVERFLPAPRVSSRRNLGLPLAA
jgi:transcriptional regulator with XRE-family HTH domain